jgi:hypothetical protein
LIDCASQLPGNLSVRKVMFSQKCGLARLSLNAVP